MRLSKTAWLILGIGIFVIALASLYMVYFPQGREQEQLNDALAATQATLPKLISQRDDLERALTTAKAELNTAKWAFPGSVESIEYGERLFKIADDCDLVITRFTSSAPAAKKEEGVTYFVTSFTVDVEGEVTDILDFINAIATSEYFASATIELVNMDIPELLTEEEKEELTEEEIEEEEMASATIKIVIYGYKGE